MLAMTEALVSPALLKWARERAELSVDGLAKTLNTTPDRVQAWEAGDRRPTFKQAEKFASATKVPFGVLFLQAPPEERVPVPDLRTMDGRTPRRFSADVLDLLRDVTFKHDWFRDHLQEIDAEPLAFVGRFESTAPAETIAADIRTILGIRTGDGGTTLDDQLRHLSERCEAARIWVMRTGYVGSDTGRSLNPEELRGFAIADRLAPLVFVNGRDARAAQAFTMAHELAHIWLGKSGIVDPALDRRDVTRAPLERLCDAVAAEVLVPAQEFLTVWQAGRDVNGNADAVARTFKVSRAMAARRAVDAGRLSWDAFGTFMAGEREAWARAERDKPKGGTFYATMPVKNGKMFTRAVLAAATRGRLLLRDAGALLHMKPAQIFELDRRMTGASE
jgi:Zn-dependent peptidase ImmA (M78 family)/DNA-binding XRE family transcriptional regulator